MDNNYRIHKETLICPICFNSSVHFWEVINADGDSDWANEYRCDNCGNIVFSYETASSVFDEKQQNKLKREIKLLYSQQKTADQEENFISLSMMF